MVADGTGKKASPTPRSNVPFGGIVGQAEMKEALLAVAASDALDGLLLRGEKGTAKSTAVRALADVLPPQRAVADCPYGCPPDDPADQCDDCRARDDPPVVERPVPLVTLPLGATRDRVVGSLSVPDALSGDPDFDPGLLARANRGILYVDEVNLLDDHLVDVLLDAAVEGVNRVERDGVSVTHPADFTLVGTMNPEEGDLRPQLRDRFALQATVTGCDDVERRATVVERALARDERSSVPSEVREATAAARERLREARERLPDVRLSGDLVAEIATLCRDAGVDGHRGDIATARAAVALAALDGRPEVVDDDVRRAAALTLPHRLQSTPFEDAPDPEEVIDEHFEDMDGSDDDEGDSATDSARSNGGEDARTDGENDPRASGDDGEEAPESDPRATGDESAGESPAPPTRGTTDDADGESPDADDPNSGDGDADEDAEPTPLIPGQSRTGVDRAAAPDVDFDAEGAADGDGRVAAAPSPDSRGARVRAERTGTDGAVDPAASVRAAAVRGGRRVERSDLRRSVRAGEASTLVVFAVDASASMRGPMRAAKGVALELLRDAYEQRDEVSLVTFAGDGARVVLPPTDSVSHAARHLKELPTGDRTPLPAGLETAREVVEIADPDAAVVVLVTDGRANAADGSPTAATRRAAERLADAGVHVVVVDAGSDRRTALTEEIASVSGGERVRLSALSAARLDETVGRLGGR